MSQVPMISNKRSRSIDVTDIHDEPQAKCTSALNYTRSLKKENFINAAKQVHGERYDYSFVSFENTHKKVHIVCSIEGHGSFSQTPSSHLRSKYGCRKCAFLITAQCHRVSEQEFVRRAKEVHGEHKYDYTSLNYVDYTTKVSIGCKIPNHPNFIQTPCSHVNNKAGCKLCGIIKVAQSNAVSPEDFIRRAKTVHGDSTYSYELVNYVNMSTEVIIICKKHGQFEQLPSVHVLQACGCRLCANENRGKQLALTTSEYIQRAIKKHGDRFDYTSVTYVNQSTPITFRCPAHGFITQLPVCHLESLSGCSRCSLTGPQSGSEFIAMAVAKHGDKYDYTCLNYVNNALPISIVCPNNNHGLFKQSVSDHLRGRGCKRCGIQSAAEKRRLSTNEFVYDLIESQGDKYDYSKVNYVNHKTPVTIVCKKHGEFKQLPCDAKVKGCLKCAIEARADLKRGTTSLFVYRAQKRFGDRFDYSKVNYIGYDVKVTIICKEHGEFQQQPNIHIMSAYGCQRCAGTGAVSEVDFINRAKRMHGEETYDYGCLNYVNMVSKVNIGCRVAGHPNFDQQAYAHTAGQGCPRCGHTNRSENAVRKVFEDIFLRPFSNVRPDFLAGLELDGYNEKLALAFEYHGEQHFHFVPHFHRSGIQELHERIKTDKRKRELCKQNGVLLLTVPYLLDYRDVETLEAFIKLQLLDNLALFDSEEAQLSVQLLEEARDALEQVDLDHVYEAAIDLQQSCDERDLEVVIYGWNA